MIGLEVGGALGGGAERVKKLMERHDLGAGDAELQVAWEAMVHEVPPGGAHVPVEENRAHQPRGPAGVVQPRCEHEVFLVLLEVQSQVQPIQQGRQTNPEFRRGESEGGRS